MLTIIQDAGWPVWPLLAASIFGLTLIIERLLVLRSSKILPARLTDEVITALGGPITTDAMERLAATSALGRILAAGLARRDRGVAAMQQAMEQAGAAVHLELGRFVTALGTLATVAPLMGLFGTVIGMIEIFAAQTPTGMNPEQLARGISIALYNTALGIFVAIPAMIFHRYFRSRIDVLTVELEQHASRVLEAAGARR